MTFPQTRLTLIQRITQQGDDEAWRGFLHDYWGPICRFAERTGRLSHHDAEDVASQAIEVLIKNDLLLQWQQHRTAKLRSLLCSVVRKVIANRARVSSRRKELLASHAAMAPADDRLLSGDVTASDNHLFYASWAQTLVWQAVDSVMCAFQAEGKSDYFRVLYGKVCEELTVVQISEALDMEKSTTENWFKTAKRRLATALRGLVLQHAERYCPDDDVDSEFALEWERMRNYLEEHGGLEATIRQCYEQRESLDLFQFSPPSVPRDPESS